ncbi:MAG: transposase [Cyanobacteria bacterium J06623_7]
MTLYQNKYRIKSTRLPNYDYSSNGYYFITICTHKKFCYFGGVDDKQMHLSQVVRISQKHWQEIQQHFKYVFIDEYVVLPNHVHGIIVINRPNNIETRNFASLPSKFAPLKPRSLPTIIHAYKSSVTRWCRKNKDADFRWQGRFYEHIIHSQKSLDNIHQYYSQQSDKMVSR